MELGISQEVDATLVCGHPKKEIGASVYSTQEVNVTLTIPEEVNVELER